MYHGFGDGVKAKGEKKGYGRFPKKKKKGKTDIVGNEAEEIVQVIQNQPKKKGKGNSRKR